MNDIELKTDELIEAIKQGEIYQTYQKSLNKLNEDKELHDQVDSLRGQVFDFQSNSPKEAMFDGVSRIEQEFCELRRNPLANEFLDAELALCTMLKGIRMQINEKIEIHLPSQCF